MGGGEIMEFNRVVHGDCLAVLPKLAATSVDLVYADPPFNTGRDFGDFDDRFADTPTFVEYIRARLTECRRVMKRTASIYLHCDPNISHHLRFALDDIFGAAQFRNEIVWCYSGGGVPKAAFASKHDVILFYAKSNAAVFNRQYRPYGEHNTTGKRATSRGGTRALEYRKEGAAMTDWWTECKPLINWHEENTGYPTQKPVALLRRIIAASSNPGDLVLDPFCGSGTTCVAAAELGRRYIGIDKNPDAVALARKRVESTTPLIGVAN